VSSVIGLLRPSQYWHHDAMSLALYSRDERRQKESLTELSIDAFITEAQLDTARVESERLAFIDLVKLEWKNSS